MSNLPERIKAWPWNNHTYAGQWHVNGRGETTEYVRKDLFDAVKTDRDTLEARVKALTEALSVADYALLEAEAILGGEYSDHYQPLCDTMTDLRNKIAALQENTDDR